MHKFRYGKIIQMNFLIFLLFSDSILQCGDSR